MNLDKTAIKRGSIMEIEKMEQIIKLIKQYDLHKVYVEKDNLKLEIQNGISGSTSLAYTNEGNINCKLQESNNKDEYIIKSPLIGVVSIVKNEATCEKYAVGDKIEAGQVLCIIEAMKMFNEVICTEEGIIEKILIEDNEFVEYDQVLSKIRINGEKNV